MWWWVVVVVEVGMEVVVKARLVVAEGFALVRRWVLMMVEVEYVSGAQAEVPGWLYPLLDRELRFLQDF